MENIETALWRESCRQARLERDAACKTLRVIAWGALLASATILGGVLAIAISAAYLR